MLLFIIEFLFPQAVNPKRAKEFQGKKIADNTRWNTDQGPTGEQHCNGLEPEMAKGGNAVEESILLYRQEHLLQMVPGNPPWQNRIAQFPGDIVLRHKGQRVADHRACNHGSKGADPQSHTERNDQDRLNGYQGQNAHEDPKGEALGQIDRIAFEALYLQKIISGQAKDAS